MGRSLIILLLPILLSLSLLIDATRNDLLALSKQENNEEDDSLILQDVYQQNAVLLVPREKENEMMMEVPKLAGTPRNENQLPTEIPNRLSLLPRVREGKSDYVFYPREGEGEGDSILRPRKGGIDFNFHRGRRGWWSRHTGAGCHHHSHHHGGEMKFRHFRGDGPHFRPQFPRSNSFPSSEDLGEAAVSSSFRSFSEESLPELPLAAENKESGFQPRERAFKRVGEQPVFPEWEHIHAHGRHDQWEREFQNGEEHKHERLEDPAAPWMVWLRSLLAHPKKLV